MQAIRDWLTEAGARHEGIIAGLIALSILVLMAAALRWPGRRRRSGTSDGGTDLTWGAGDMSGEVGTDDVAACGSDGDGGGDGGGGCSGGDS